MIGSGGFGNRLRGFLVSTTDLVCDFLSFAKFVEPEEQVDESVERNYRSKPFEFGEGPGSDGPTNRCKKCRGSQRKSNRWQAPLFQLRQLAFRHKVARHIGHRFEPQRGDGTSLLFHLGHEGGTVTCLRGPGESARARSQYGILAVACDLPGLDGIAREPRESLKPIVPEFCGRVREAELSWKAVEKKEADPGVARLDATQRDFLTRKTRDMANTNPPGGRKFVSRLCSILSCGAAAITIGTAAYKLAERQGWIEKKK